MHFTLASVLSLLAIHAVALPTAQPQGPTLSWTGLGGSGCTIGFGKGQCTDLLGNSAHLGASGFGVNLSTLC
jgi:hypothetical protein